MSDKRKPVPKKGKVNLGDCPPLNFKLYVDKVKGLLTGKEEWICSSCGLIAQQPLIPPFVPYYDRERYPRDIPPARAPRYPRWRPHYKRICQGGITQ